MINTSDSLSCLRTKPTGFLALSQFFGNSLGIWRCVAGPAGHFKTSLAKVGRLAPSIRALRDRWMQSGHDSAAPTWQLPIRLEALRCQEQFHLPSRSHNVSVDDVPGQVSRLPVRRLNFNVAAVDELLERVLVRLGIDQIDRGKHVRIRARHRGLHQPRTQSVHKHNDVGLVDSRVQCQRQQCGHLERANGELTNGLLNFSPERRPAIWLEACIDIALETGMRAGEILSLTWDQVDLNQCCARLEKTKNGSRRTVGLSHKAVSVLQNLPRTSARVISNFYDTSGLDRVADAPTEKPPLWRSHAIGSQSC